MAIRYKYNGAGFLANIPARDLEDDDVDALSDDARALLEAHMALGTDKAPAGLKGDDLAAWNDENGRLAAARIYEAVGGAQAPAVAPDNG
jgi:hypothetical protein